MACGGGPEHRRNTRKAIAHEQNRRTTQSVQSEITLRANSGTDRSVAFATRRTNDATTTT